MTVILRCSGLHCIIFGLFNVVLGFNEYQNHGLTLLNTIRVRHRSQPLVLDSDLSESAEKCAAYYASLGKVDHRCAVKSHATSESIVSGFIHQLNLTESDLVENAIKVWYEQEVNYRYSKPGLQIDAEDFTKMVWDASRNVGIGYSQFINHGTYGVCVVFYSPPGNVIQSYAHNVFKPSQSLAAGTKSVFDRKRFPDLPSSEEMEYLANLQNKASSESSNEEKKSQKDNGKKKSKDTSEKTTEPTNQE